MQPQQGFIPYDHWTPQGDPLVAAQRFKKCVARRRSVRHFSDRPVPGALIETIIAAAGTAPSGANKQPWRFVAVDDPAIKREIRIAAEAEEQRFYNDRAPADYLSDLRPLGTDADKPLLEAAPWLIAVFKIMRDEADNNLSERTYYVGESVGIACGLLLAAAQHAGLATLTHTPSPMKFLCQILKRPDYERPFLLIPVGWPIDGCLVPDITRKPLDEIMVCNRPGDDAK
ncbi:MAG TPA: nitroreductase family protein [Phycisphaerales bacterium]|nr:nitroreductase family protein [Phycisphaerales bacterium]